MSFEAAWERSAPLLDAALAHGGRTHRLANVEALLRSGAAQLWTSPNAAIVTLIEEDPCERRLLLWLAGGELRELIDVLLPPLEQWARARGCTRLLVVGRAGWERALAPRGFAPLARVIAKEL